METSKPLAWDEIPEHENAATYQDELPKVGAKVDGQYVVATRVFSALWFTENVLMVGMNGRPVPENIYSKPSATCGTALLGILLSDAHPRELKRGNLGE